MKTIDEITSKDFWAHNLTLKLSIIGVMILLLLISFKHGRRHYSLKEKNPTHK